MPDHDEEPADERAKRYLVLAEAARRHAARSSDIEMRLTYLQLAHGWENLAAQIQSTHQDRPAGKVIPLPGVRRLEE